LNWRRQPKRSRPPTCSIGDGLIFSSFALSFLMVIIIRAAFHLTFFTPRKMSFESNSKDSEDRESSQSSRLRTVSRTTNDRSNGVQDDSEFMEFFADKDRCGANVTIVRAMKFLNLRGELCCAQDYCCRGFGDAEGLTNLAIRTMHQDCAGF
jgi:hypothetical protein